jgi:hypothetical protein
LITNPGLEVRPRPSELNLRTSTITFDQDVLQAPDHRVVKAIRALEPRRIDAELERVEEKAVTLDKSMVRFVYPDSKLFPDFPERLRLEAAVFAPQQVRVQGPRSVTGDARNGAFLYHLDLSGFTGINEPRIVAQLTQEPLENVTIDGGPVTITIPLDPRFEPFEMTVPIMVDTASRTNPRADDFEHDPTMPVTVFASGDLVGVLSRMNDNELDDWVKRIARVHVLLEDDWRNEPQYMIGTFWLFDTRYERGRHYRTKTTLSVQIRPKTKH